MPVLAVIAKAFSIEKELILSRVPKEFIGSLDPRSNHKLRCSSKEIMRREQF